MTCDYGMNNGINIMYQYGFVVQYISDWINSYDMYKPVSIA